MVQVPSMMFSYGVCGGAAEEKGACVGEGGGKVEGGDGEDEDRHVGKGGRYRHGRPSTARRVYHLYRKKIKG